MHPGNRIKRFAWIAIGVALLVVLVWESGPSRIVSDLGLIGGGLIVVVVLELVVDWFNTVGWWFTFPPALRGGTLTRLFFVRLAGTALNTTLPAASVGGEPAKVYLLSDDFPVATVIATIMTSTLLFTLAKAGYIAAGTMLTFVKFHLSREFAIGMLAGFAATLAGTIGFLLLQLRGFSAWTHRIIAWLPLPEKWAEGIQQMVPHVDAEISALLRTRPRDLIMALCSHWLAFACGVVQVVLLLGWLGLPRSITGALAIESFSMLLGFVAFMVPGALGVQEGGKLLIFTAIGLPAAAGVTVGIAFRLTSIVCAGAGLLTLAVLKGRKKAEPVAAEEGLARDLVS